MSRLAEAFRRAAADAPDMDSFSHPMLRDIVSVPESVEDPWNLRDRSVGPEVVSIAPPGVAAPQVPPQIPNRPVPESRSISREEALALASRLFAPGSNDHPRAVLFSGADAESPSAAVTAAVAQALANETSGSVCLVEANLRTPSLQALFGATSDQGFSDVLLDGSDIRHGLSRISTNLWLLACGSRGTDALHGLNVEQLRPRFQELLAMFDYLVVDAAPASEYRDTAVIGSLVDGVVVVVSANATRREVARRTVAHLQDSGVHVLGAVLANRTFPIPEAIYRKL